MVALAVGSCARRSQVAVDASGRAVLEDAYDGHLDRDWSCGSLRAAVKRLPPGGGPMYSPLPGRVMRAAGRTCDAALRNVRVGLSRPAVTTALGAAAPPGPHCSRYDWPPAAPSSAVDGARVCFAAGRVTRVLVSVHG